MQKFGTTSGTLCNDFIKQARKTWDWIKISIATNINLGEESITDFNLLELQNKHPNEIKTQKFTKRREAQEGADWEWWLGSGNNWLGLRVQAKKIDSTNLKYPNLGNINKYGRQVDLLIDKANKHQPPLIPIYVFYNYWNPKMYDPLWQCRSYPKQLKMLGCGICDANFVRSVINSNNNDLKDLIDKMYPWSCLICCQGYSNAGTNLPTRAFNFIVGALNREIKDDEQKFFLKEAPRYVYKILKNEVVTEEDWESIAVDRVTVIYEEEQRRYPLPYVNLSEEKRVRNI